ncbi:hypothetical protein MSPP1_002873 [Malassezia sp. CBS 17886]|nr:hypothetical protein MSPP1_002873 [Malassezia sp. CBS 17886]
MQWGSVLGAVLFALATHARASSVPRGVAPQDAPRYAPTHSAHGTPMWKCLGDGKEIPFARVNDDYCDCADGSDEPGTSACDNGRFYCENRGFFPSYIDSTRVNDGVCDPECCDGSDETDGKVVCPNICDKVNRAYRKRIAKEDKVHAAGVRIRGQYIASAQRDRQHHESELARLEPEWARAQDTEQQLKRAAEAAESLATAYEEQKKSSPLFATLQDHQGALRALWDQTDRLSGHVRVLSGILQRLEGDASERGAADAVAALREWCGYVTDDADENVPATLEQKLERVLDDDPDAAHVEALLREDPLALLDGAPDTPPAAHRSHTLFHVPSYLPDVLLPWYEKAVAWLVHALEQAQIVSPGTARVPRVPQSGVDAAYDAHAKAEAHVHKLRADITLHKQWLRQDVGRYGREGEFRALDKQCFKKNMGDYTYEFCFGGQVSQISNNDGYRFSLGQFARFDPAGKYPPSADEHYYTALFDRGQSCWNGPVRSTLVTLECGEENALLHVFEAEKCRYSMRVSTPAVCFPRPERAAEGVAHSEL